MLAICSYVAAVAVLAQANVGKLRPVPPSISSELPKVGGTIRMEHFWANQLVDYLSVTIPSSVSSNDATVIARINDLYGIADRPASRFALTTDRFSKAPNDWKDFFAMSLIWWGRSKVPGEPELRATCRDAAVLSMETCIKSLESSPRPDPDHLLLAKLARILIRDDGDAKEIGALRELETEALPRAPAVALMANWHRSRLSDPELDRKLVRKRYSALSGYRIYRLLTN